MTTATPPMPKAKPDAASEYCAYASTRIDERILPLARAAAALSGDVSTQEFISDAVNRAAAEVLKRPPVKRLPAPPKPHGKGRPRPAR